MESFLTGAARRPPSPPSPSLPRPPRDRAENMLQNSDFAPKNSDGENRPNEKLQNSTELPHLYKNRLLEYTQKKNLPIPAYVSEMSGPPHHRLFKASVTVDGMGYYECAEYHLTLKKAEHAAAKVALEHLTVESEKLQSAGPDGLMKGLLQELAQKHGYPSPSYSTKMSGQAHQPTFVSLVKLAGVTYEGEQCKSKKLSEFSAAKVAYEKFAHAVQISGGAERSSSTVATGIDNAPIGGSTLIPDSGEAEGGAEATRIDGHLSDLIREHPDSSEGEGNAKRYKRSLSL